MTLGTSFAGADADALLVAAGLNDCGLAEALARLARGEQTDFAALLHDVEVHAVIDGTKVTCHCYSLKLDAHGRPRISELAQALAERATDFAIPRKRVAEAALHFNTTGSTSKFNRLRDEARSLFTDITNSGEGGELLLFVLAETMLKLPQLICKMSLKTNSRMHVHGADGLHGQMDLGSDRLALYWGESKIYANASDAIRECLSSLAPMLKETGPEAESARDLQLLDRAIDLNDQLIEEALRRYLDPRDLAFLKLEFRGLCLVGFDCDAYPTGSGNSQNDLVAEIGSRLPSWKQSISGRVAAEQLTDFTIHALCVPFPSAESFRCAMRRALGIDRGTA